MESVAVKDAVEDAILQLLKSKSQLIQAGINQADDKKGGVVVILSGVALVEAKALVGKALSIPCLDIGNARTMPTGELSDRICRYYHL
jgi:hypothetical protein